jgi:hypothetical protein
MKKVLLLFSMLCLASGLLQAQERYLDAVFSDVAVTADVVYGVNATVLLLPQVGEAVPQPLLMDVYQPAGDTETARPLVILMPTGNFLPPQINGGCTGTRKDASTVFMARELAKRGYVAAIADYRLGWNPVDPDQTVRVFTLINAAYRGVQDSRTCVRFFNRSIAEAGNPFRVDPERITLWGVGTGGYISLASATLDTITDTWTPPFITAAGPMVIEQVNGDINAEKVGVTFPGYPGFPAGDTLCYPNHVGFSSEFRLAVNLGGALGHPSWMDANDPPTISFHVPTDPFAPCDEGLVLVPPPVNLPVVDVVGSCFLQPVLNDLGVNDVFKSVTFIDDISATASARNGGIEGFFPFPVDDPTESSPWAYSASSEPYGIPGTDCEIDSASAHIYIDTIMQYFLPRACLALDLGCDLSNLISSTANLQAADIKLQLMPNPAQDAVYLNTDAEFTMNSIQVFDINGRLVRNYPKVQAHSFTIERGNLPPGMYVARLWFDQGIAAQKFIFK